MKLNETINGVRDATIQKQLTIRKERLQGALLTAPNPTPLLQLLEDVDAALDRLEGGTFGICETCHEAIESERLLADPLCRNCLDHLSPTEQRALEHDLDLAFQVQRGLLPQPGLAAKGWSMAFRYQPAGPVSGDFCDLIRLDDASSLFLLGDVMGKGVAASLLTSHLHAIFRSLSNATRPVEKLVSKANEVFCEGTLSSFFATLVCGRLVENGSLEICNAGHCHPLCVRNGKVEQIEAGGLPLGLVREAEYSSEGMKFSPGDSVVIHSDGLSEAFNNSGEQYGTDRLAEVLELKAGQSANEQLAAVLSDLDEFRGNTPVRDDLTVMVIRREL